MNRHDNDFNGDISLRLRAMRFTSRLVISHAVRSPDDFVMVLVRLPQVPVMNPCFSDQSRAELTISGYDDGTVGQWT